MSEDRINQRLDEAKNALLDVLEAMPTKQRPNIIVMEVRTRPEKSPEGNSTGGFFAQTTVTTTPRNPKPPKPPDPVYKVPAWMIGFTVIVTGAFLIYLIKSL